MNNLLTFAPVQQRSHGRYKPFLFRHRITDMDSGSGRANDSMWFKTVRSSSAIHHNHWFKIYIIARPPNGLDRSCEATIYPVLDKPPPPGLVTTEERYDHFLGLLHNLCR
jgi:hypothetical protein